MLPLKLKGQSPPLVRTWEPNVVNPKEESLTTLNPYNWNHFENDSEDFCLNVQN